MKNFYHGFAQNSTPTPEELLRPPLAYAARRWPVLPLWWPASGRCACGDRGCPSPAKHPIGALTPHGLKDATTDPAVIRAWWGRCPKANLAIVTGSQSALLVLDLDPRHGGHPDRLPGPVPRTPTVRTGGGGWHYYLSWPQEVERLPKSLPGCPGVDLKGSGGYVVVPPSRHISGTYYRWKVSPNDAPLARCPDWLLEAIAEKPTAPPRAIKPVAGGACGTAYGRAALRAELARLAQVPVGDRNNALNRAAFALGKLVAAGHLELATVEGLLENMGVSKGLTPREVRTTIRSGLQAGLGVRHV